MKIRFITPLLLAACISTATLQAAEVPKSPDKQSSWGLYVDSKEVAAMKQKLGNKMLLVDVRDPVEIMFTGFSDVVDINIPFKTADRTTWHKKKPVFNMKTNTNFEQDLAAALKARGLTKDAPIAIMCRSGGTRGAPATKLLENKGYKNVYVVTDGFEGGTVKEGEKKNWRLKDGWKNSGLPWSYKLNKEKMYMAPATKPVVAEKNNDQAATEKTRFTAMLDHANPMPNYMPVVMKNAKTLALTDEQTGKLKSWVAANNKKSVEVVKRIVQIENDLAMASMHGADKPTLMKKYSEMADLRIKLASSKTDCRDNIRKILSTEQWNKLVDLQQAIQTQQASL